jgi:hypothetical protein
MAIKPKITAFSPKAFQFWSSNEARPKRIFEAMLIFPDLIFGGDGMQNIEPYLVVSFSRPGYADIESKTAEYQMACGDFAKIEYPTGGYRTKQLDVTLLDVVNHNKGANTAAAVHTSLTLQGKTLEYEEKVSGLRNDGFSGGGDGGASAKIQQAWKENPKRFSIIEFDNKGQTVGEWKIDKPILTSANFSDINYKGTGFGTISLSFAYKNFSYDSSWGDKLLSTRLDMIGKNRTTIADALDKAGAWVNEKTNWASKIK